MWRILEEINVSMWKKVKIVFREFIGCDNIYFKEGKWQVEMYYMEDDLLL